MKAQNTLLNEKIVTLQQDLRNEEPDKIIEEYDELIEVNSTISKQLKLSRLNKSNMSDIKQTNLNESNGKF